MYGTKIQKVPALCANRKKPNVQKQSEITCGAFGQVKRSDNKYKRNSEITTTNTARLFESHGPIKRKVFGGAQLTVCNYQFAAPRARQNLQEFAIVIWLVYTKEFQ